MIHRHTLKQVICCVSLFTILSSQAATLTVTNLLDDGSAGSLRTTIDQANAGDTIVFSVSGTIFLEATNGELLVDKQLTINGDTKITIDGGNAIATGFHITASGKNSMLLSLTIQHFSDIDEMGSGGSETGSAGTGITYTDTTASHDVHGILIDNGATGCSIEHCTIQEITGTSTLPQTVYGIKVLDDFTSIHHNQIQFILSASSLTNNSGDVIALYASSTRSDRCTNNFITLLATGDALQHASGNLAGIVLQGTIHTVTHNTVFNCVTGKGFNNSGDLFGIQVETEGNLFTHNTVDHLRSGIAAQSSGSIQGMFVRSASGDCAHNTVTGLISAPALNPGEVVGLSITDATTHITYNHLSGLTAGEGVFRKAARGITIDTISENQQVSCNTIEQIYGGEGEPQFAPSNTVGLYIRQADQVTIQGNLISDITGDNGQFTTGMQLGWADIEDTVTNASITNNHIHTVSDITSGYGITILNQNSKGNALLTNSIFDTTGKAINILGNTFNGDDISAFPDGVVLLDTSNCTNRGKIELTGEIIPGMGLDGQPFLLQFFASDTNPPAVIKTLIFQYMIDTSESTSFSLKFTPLVATHFGQYITATATAMPEPPAHNWNTSEVSNALSACNSSESPYSPFICPEVPGPIPPVDCGNCPFIPSNNNASDIL